MKLINSDNDLKECIDTFNRTIKKTFFLNILPKTVK